MVMVSASLVIHHLLTLGVGEGIKPPTNPQQGMEWIFLEGALDACDRECDGRFHLSRSTWLPPPAPTSTGATGDTRHAAPPNVHDLLPKLRNLSLGRQDVH